MSHSLQVRRADAPLGVRGIVSVDGVWGRPGRLFPALGPAGKRRRRVLLPAEADWRPCRSGSGPTVCRIGSGSVRPSTLQAGSFSACPTPAGSHPLSGMVRRERWGGHPGHDQGRRHSLPRVVAPQALFPVARRSGHRSGCHHAAVWCGPTSPSHMISAPMPLAIPSRETREIRNEATDQCRSFGGSITISGGEAIPPRSIVTNHGPSRFPPSTIRCDADQRPSNRRCGAILLGCARLSSRKLDRRATRGKPGGVFSAGAFRRCDNEG